MGNIQPSGAGDGPKNLKWNTGSTSSPWMNLPLQVYTLLGSKMDVKNFRAMRLVCSKWRSNVEQHDSLKVKVDDSIPGNLEFAKRVKIVNARILNWTVKDIRAEPANHLFQYPDHLKKLDLCGRMPSQWKIHNLTQFPNLAHLVLRNRALGSNNLTGHEIQFFPSTREPPSEAQPIELKSLQTLLITSEPAYLPGSEMVKTNVGFICNNIKSPVLSVAHFDVIGSLFSLHIFLDNHRTSLRYFYFPRFFCANLINYEKLFSFPVNLRKLKLYFNGRSLYSQESASQSPFTYLQTLLDGQTRVEDVYLDFFSCPVKLVRDAFTSLASRCARTLRYIELECILNHDSGVLDLEVLSVCRGLEVLHMPCWGRASMTFENVDKLPTSLKRLVIRCSGNGGTVELGDPNFFGRLTALEWLSLDWVHIPRSKSGNQEPERLFCRSMIKGLLGLRQLQGFHLVLYRVGLNWDTSVVKMLNAVGRHINPAERSLQGSVSFNLGWWPFQGSSAAPWSDKPFDKEILDVEKELEAKARENANGVYQEDYEDKQDEDVDDLEEKDVNLPDEDDL